MTRRARRPAAGGLDVPRRGRFWFSGFDDLIAMKVTAGRPQDRIDVTTLYSSLGR
jgi:hypothetical protein